MAPGAHTPTFEFFKARAIPPGPRPDRPGRRRRGRWHLLGREQEREAGAARLQAFGSCGELLAYVKLHATRLVGPWGLGGAIGDGREGGVVPAPATDRAKGTPGVDYSTTNVQEAGIDEPDMVKTDGLPRFRCRAGKLHAIDLRSGRPRLVDSVELAGGWGHELLLHGKRLLVISHGARWLEPLPGIARSSFPWRPSGTFLASIDVSDPSELRVVQTLEFDGSYLTARLADGTARMVVNSSVLGELEFDPPKTDDPQATAAATEHNRAVIASSGLSKTLPARDWIEFPRPREVPVVGGKIDPTPVPRGVGGSEPAQR